MRGLQIITNRLQVCFKGRVAQSVEQRIENPRVASSILAPATNFLPLSFSSQIVKFYCSRSVLVQ